MKIELTLENTSALARICRILHLEGQIEHVVNTIVADELALLDDQPEMVQCLVEHVIYEKEEAARAGAEAALARMTNLGKVFCEESKVCVDWTGGRFTLSAMDVGWENYDSRQTFGGGFLQE